MPSSTEKDTIHGRAVARVRDRYRDTLLAQNKISMREYRTVLRALNAVKHEVRQQIRQLVERFDEAK